MLFSFNIFTEIFIDIQAIYKNLLKMLSGYIYFKDLTQLFKSLQYWFLKGHLSCCTILGEISWGDGNPTGLNTEAKLTNWVEF